MLLQGSALSGTLARLPTHPLDTLKARLQTLRAGSMAAGARPPSALELLRTIARTEGLRGLYRGLGVTLTLGPFASVLYFTGYEVRGQPAAPCPAPSRAGFCCGRIRGATCSASLRWPPPRRDLVTH